MNPDTLFWVYNDTSLLSMRQVHSKVGPIVRITLRNMTGRYVWDAKLNYETVPKNVAYGMPIAAERPEVTFEAIIQRKAQLSVEPRKAARAPGAIPTSDVECQRDGLFEALSYLEERHPEVLPTANVYFTEPYDPLNITNETLSHFETSLVFQDEDERAYVPPASKRAPLMARAADSAALSADPQSSFHWARLFFHLMGFTSDTMFSTLCLVDNTDKFRRTLKELDKRMCREHVKG